MSIDNNNIDNFDDEMYDEFKNLSNDSFINNEINSKKLNNNDINNNDLNNEEYLDYLSSKYIDADLSLEEDKILRNLTNQNPELKDNFFNNIDIYQTIKKESKNIDIPFEFLNDTENLLVDKLFNKNNVLEANSINLQNDYPNFNNYDYHIDEFELLENEGSNNVIKMNNKNSIFNKLSLVAACFLLFFVYNINEFKNTNTINSFADLNFEIKLNQEDENSYSNNSDNLNNSDLSRTSLNRTDLNTSKLTNRNLSNKTELKSQESNFNGNIILSNINNDTKDEIPVFENTKNENIIDPITKSESTSNVNSNGFNNNSLNNTNNNISPNAIILVPSNNSSNLNGIDNTTLNTNNSFIYQSNQIKTNFKLNSSISNDLNNSRFTDKNNAIISHYAQSIAIQIDDNNDIGVEFGFSDFNFDDKANLSITTEIPNNTPGSNLKEYKTIIVPVELRKNYTLYWGLGFIEKNLFKHNDFTINSKFAFGFSNDGPQSYLRMSAKYELFKNLNLNIGLDARYMNVNLPFYVNTNNINSTTSLSLNYGIQYQF